MYQSKACSRCKQVLPYEAFNLDKRLKSGRKAQCRVCQVTSNAETYARHAEKRRVENRIRYKQDPAKYIAIVRKYQNKYPDRVTANQVNFRKNNPEKIRTYRRERRTRMANNKSFRITDKEVSRLYASPCFYCNKYEEITIEHLIPVSRNGDDGIGNLVALCKSCNSSKHNKTWMEWRIWKIRQAKTPQSPTHD